MRIVLCGMPGSGKTTVGQALAALLGLDFLDTDALIEARYGAPSHLLRTRGESYFRDVEAEVFRGALERDNAVIATGGGIVVREENRARLMGEVVFFLHASPKELSRRLAGDDTRYLLRGDREAALGRLYSEREALYEQVGVPVETEGRTAEEIAETIRKELNL